MRVGIQPINADEHQRRVGPRVYGTRYGVYVSIPVSIQMTLCSFIT